MIHASRTLMSRHSLTRFRQNKAVPPNTSRCSRGDSRIMASIRRIGNSKATMNVLSAIAATRL
jgi:hypothetical protein